MVRSVHEGRCPAHREFPHIVGSIQTSAVILVGHHGYATIGLDTGHPASPTFAGHQLPLSIAGETIRPISGFVRDGDTLPFQLLLSTYQAR